MPLRVKPDETLSFGLHLSAPPGGPAHHTHKVGWECGMGRWYSVHGNAIASTCTLVVGGWGGDQLFPSPPTPNSSHPQTIHGPALGSRTASVRINITAPISSPACYNKLWFLLNVRRTGEGVGLVPPAPPHPRWDLPYYHLCHITSIKLNLPLIL